MDCKLLILLFIALIFNSATCLGSKLHSNQIDNSGIEYDTSRSGYFHMSYDSMEIEINIIEAIKLHLELMKKEGLKYHYP